MSKQLYYKYRNFNNFEYLLDILLYERLYATSYLHMNDPMEGLYYAYGLKRQVLQEIKKSKDFFNICSFSTECNNNLLWAHYADGGRGINIVFEVTGHSIDIRPIKYESAPVITECIHVNTTAREILCYKDPSWIYEQEHRAFTKKSYVKIKIRKIIFGVRISSVHKKLIKDLVKKILPDVEIEQCKVNS